MMASEQAKLWLGNSGGFFVAARCIADHMDAAEFPWPPFFTNVGYAFELSLKAYILARGGTEKECKALGHNLNAAVESACALGLERPDDTTISVLGSIGRYHCERSFQYMKPVDVAALPNVRETLEAMEQHFASMARHLPELFPA